MLKAAHKTFSTLFVGSVAETYHDMDRSGHDYMAFSTLFVGSVAETMADNNAGTPGQAFQYLFVGSVAETTNVYN